VDLYIHFPIRPHGVVLNSLSTGTTLPFTFSLAMSVTQLFSLEEKRFLQGVRYFINKIPKFIFKKEIYVQNINGMFLELV
jgi:hypothetical protein